jgi:general secretion pathway protein G
MKILKSEIRNPKSEINSNSEFRRPKSEISPKTEFRNPKEIETGKEARTREGGPVRFSGFGLTPVFGFRTSSFGLISDFGTRISDFKQRISDSTHRRFHSAFTLVELLLVLTILGILAAIVVPKFTGRTEQARITAARTQISTFSTALEAYEVDTGAYPRSLSDLVQLPRDTQNWKGPYLQGDIPLDPWQHPYVYVFPGKHMTAGFDLYSLGFDGREGTEDDITNWQQPTRQ